MSGPSRSATPSVGFVDAGDGLVERPVGATGRGHLDRGEDSDLVEVALPLTRREVHDLADVLLADRRHRRRWLHRVGVLAWPDEAHALDPAIGPLVPCCLHHPPETLGAREVLVVAARTEGFGLHGAGSGPPRRHRTAADVPPSDRFFCWTQAMVTRSPTFERDSVRSWCAPGIHRRARER